MAVRDRQYPKLSDWTIPQPDESRNRHSLSINSAETIDINQSDSDGVRKRGAKSLCKSLTCWPSISPCFQGLLLGILTNSLTLATVLTLWLVPHYKTGVIITNEVPPGTILLFGGNLSTLNGSTYRWLLCDGSEVSRVTYSDLFDVIGITYGFGNGNDTFNVPDFSYRFPLGSSGGPLNAGGASSHTISVAELPMHYHDQGTLQTLSSGLHAHNYVDPGHNHGGSTNSQPMSGGSFAMLSTGGAGNDRGTHTHTISLDFTNITIQSDGNHTHTVEGLTGPEGQNQTFEIMPPYQTVYYIIRA